MKFETLAVHAGHEVDPGTGAVTPPIHLSTTYERDKDGSYPQGYVYARGGNPNRTALEECLAALEGGTNCAAFASGTAATLAVFQTLSPGDHVPAVARDLRAMGSGNRFRGHDGPRPDRSGGPSQY